MRALPGGPRRPRPRSRTSASTCSTPTVERLRRTVPDTFAASLDGLSRDAGCPGDERRRCRRHDVAAGRARRRREGGARLRDAGRLGRGRRRSGRRGAVYPGARSRRATRSGSRRPCRRALGDGRDPRLREAMHAYGRRPIAERVLGRVPAHARSRGRRDDWPATRARVVFVCPNLEAGGAERQWAALVPGLAGRGFDVSRDHARRPRSLLRRAATRAALRSRARTCVTGPTRPGLRASCAWPGRASSAVVTRGVSAHLVGQALARRQRAAHVVTEHLGPDPLRMRAHRPPSAAAPRPDAAARDGCRRRRREPDGASRAATATAQARSA